MEPTPTLRLLIPRPCLIILCGASGCGKSSFALRHFRSTEIVSSDECRALVSDDENNQRVSPEAFELLYHLLELRLKLGRLCVADTTASSPEARARLRRLGRRQGVPVLLVLFNIPVAICVERDRQRPRSVGPGVIAQQFEALAAARDSIWDEGYDQVVLLGPEEMERVEIAYVRRA